MKKILFSIIAVFCSITAMAGDDVTIASGSLAEIKAAGEAKVYVEWDYSNATLEKKPVAEFLKEKGSDWESEYPGELRLAESELKKAFGKCKFVNLVESKDQAQYVFTIKMLDFHYGSTGAAVVIGWGAGDAHFDADITVTNTASQATVAVIKADGVPGGGWGNTKRRCDAYKELGEWFAKLVKKAKTK